LTLNNIVILKSGLEVSQGHSNWYHSKHFDHITAIDMLLCTSLRKFIQIGPPSAEK